MEAQKPAPNPTTAKPSKPKFSKRFVAKLKRFIGRKSKKSEKNNAVSDTQPVQQSSTPGIQAATWKSIENGYGNSRYTSMPTYGASLSAQDEYRRRILGFSVEEYLEYVPGGRVRRGTYEVEVLN